MQIISTEIRRSVENVESIMLAGGFGRGEGTVSLIHNGEYAPLNDYDIYVLSETAVSIELIRMLESRLWKKCHIRVDIKFISTKSLGFVIPDMFTYELKTTSKVIWGLDLRKKIPHEREDIPLTAGLNTLLIEALGLIQNFEPEYFHLHVPSAKRPMANYICTKVFVEIGNALSLLGKFYDSLSSKRAELLETNYKTKFPELYRLLPGLPSQVKFHTQLKLVSLDFDTEYSVARWLEAREALKFSMWYFICRVLDITFDTGQSFFCLLDARQEELASFYFEPYIQYALKRKGIPAVQAFVRIAQPFVRLYENFRYSRNCRDATWKVCIRPFFSLQSPLLKIFLCGVFLLYSLEEDGQVNRNLLEKAHALLAEIYPCPPLSDNEYADWRNLRDLCLHSQRIYSSTPRTLAF